MSATPLETGTVVSSGEFFTLKVPSSASFEPKEDITAYELAQMIPMFHGAVYYEEEWNALPWTRHWRRTDK